MHKGNNIYFNNINDNVLFEKKFGTSQLLINVICWFYFPPTKSLFLNLESKHSALFPIPLFGLKMLSFSLQTLREGPKAYSNPWKCFLIFDHTQVVKTASGLKYISVKLLDVFGTLFMQMLSECETPVSENDYLKRSFKLKKVIESKLKWFGNNV